MKVLGAKGKRDTPRILAVSSGGGHWQQLHLVLPAFANAKVTLACSSAAQADAAHVLPECNLRTPLKVLACLREARRLVRRLQPEIVISTGAAPGLLVLLWAKLFGARTIWIDSVANAERLSLSGRLAYPLSDLWLTQWPQVSEESGATYAGAVL
ncbi:oligosaccharide biosynthesis protein Alg14 [Litoreibacter ponti]|uniref:Oligosaccharide biosynthesis protein Alg14 n=1 Tax=Litoreibacter ponti TaxID=1510457 RepID=A0A2T6BPC5_9RHOB|nr:UDP-N-acetylglucosamine--LPS N-acetylglucosamine transferase [Litoreibacter ponti]PTX57933.1 oligosaccharide biosynthesis protein Alg14 [Litoreibacter ponti]